MRKKKLAILVLFCSTTLLSFASTVSAQDVAAKPLVQPVVLKWLGNAGWEIKVGRTIILIDPFLTRQEPDRSGGEWISDEEAVLKVIKRADYIFTGHSHADHIGDVPCIANKFGSMVYGSGRTIAIARKAGVSNAQLVTVKSGGEPLRLKEFSVQVIDSVHGVLNQNGRRRKPAPKEISRPCPERIPGNIFEPGDSFLYLFTFGNRKILHQSTGGFITDKIGGLRADVALLYPMNHSDTENMLKELEPKTVFVHHFDEWRAPFPDSLPARSLARARRFTLAVNAIDSNIRVITPNYFEPYPIPYVARDRGS